MSVATPYFDQLFAGNDDPWAFRQRWYEQRKRALTLAVLTLSLIHISEPTRPY